jgi:hypothetical protein
MPNWAYNLIRKPVFKKQLKLKRPEVLPVLVSNKKTNCTVPLYYGGGRGGSLLSWGFDYLT